MMTDKKKLQVNLLCSLIAIGICVILLYSINTYTNPNYMLRTVLQLGSIYALAAISKSLAFMPAKEFNVIIPTLLPMFS